MGKLRERKGMKGNGNHILIHILIIAIIVMISSLFSYCKYSFSVQFSVNKQRLCGSVIAALKCP